jgi:hypothetical protein
VPLTQVILAGQTFPQPPQLLLSVVVSTQVLPHRVGVPVGQQVLKPAYWVPLGHSTHCPLELATRLPGQLALATQASFWQIMPPGQ